MTDLTEIENAWCDWTQRFRRNRSGEPAPVASFKAGAAYECSRIRRELLDEMKIRERLVHTSIADHSSNGYERMIPAEALMTALDRICPEEG